MGASAIDPAIVERYRKVQAMYNGATTPGEKAAARTALDKMETKYPGIVGEAAADPSPLPGFTAEDLAELLRVAYGSATKLFDWLQEAVDDAVERAEVRELVEEIDVTARDGKRQVEDDDGKKSTEHVVNIVFIVPSDTMQELVEAYAEDTVMEGNVLDALTAHARSSFKELFEQLSGDSDATG